MIRKKRAGYKDHAKGWSTNLVKSDNMAETDVAVGGIQHATRKR